MKTSAPFPPMLSALLVFCSLTTTAQDDPVSGPHECTIHLIDRSKVPVTRFWRIDAYTVEYEHAGSLHDVPLASVQRIQCENGDYAIIDQRLLSIDSLALASATLMMDTLTTPSERYQLGQEDGKEYYSGGGAFVGGMLAAPTLIGPWIIAAVRPPLDSPKNPNLALLNDPDYRSGYKKAAHQKKAGHALLGMITGFALFFAIAAD